MANTGIIGAGSWSIGLATVLQDNGHEVTMWSALPDEIEQLRETHESPSKLPGVKLSEKTQFTTRIEEAIRGKDLVVIAVPSVFVRSTAAQMAPFVAEGQILVDVAKGIEEGTLKFMTEIVEEEIPQAKTAVLSGPSHAEEVGRRMPTTIVSGSHEKAVAEYVQTIFMNERFRVYTSPDVTGISIGGSLKNVIALAAGMADGMGYGDNTKAALITRGMKELTKIGLAMGAARETIEGLSGLGDLFVTCSSVHSRNRKAGYLMGQGMGMEEAMKEVNMVVEGVYSAKAAKALADRYGLSLPIIEEVNRVLFEGVSVREGLSNLMQRDRRAEHTSLAWDQ